MKFNFNICFNFNETLCNYCFKYNYKRKIISFVRANERVHDIIKEESKWGEGGVAFIGHESNKDTKTYARKYLNTDEQFGEVVEQENNVDALHINVQDIMDKGYVDLEADWYGRAIYLGKEDGAPMFTFTNPDVMGPPSILFIYDFPWFKRDWPYKRGNCGIFFN
ncbi:hypothetical protein MKY30_02130 [Oceanobacillus sp. FSL W8-0428]|uniref:Uncharacterized protein n=1 Tax=Oceanobacillus sojae TaxID=582851 RepID=A0A511ZHR3_9BACI|nr:hypothetical protein [Oceanobacillus sojae]GEN86985.1 hypothetical protein OSO01_17240 [Oceanobacillus sojae]